MRLIFEHNKTFEDKASLVEDVRRVIRIRLGNRAKESLMVDFINQTDLDQIGDKASVIDAFLTFARAEQQREVARLRAGWAWQRDRGSSPDVRVIDDHERPSVVLRCADLYFGCAAKAAGGRWGAAARQSRTSSSSDSPCHSETHQRRSAKAKVIHIVVASPRAEVIRTELDKCSRTDR